jgi:hypothetical protein
VQLYTDDAALVSTVTEFVAHGLADGAGVVAITTLPHRIAVCGRLAERGVDVAAAEARGQLTVLDARDTLAQLLVDGMPDGAAMRAVIVPVLQRARGAGSTTVRAFGEMVDILYRGGRLAAAIRLEELWNELLEREGFTLLCAYAVDAFDRAQYGEALPRIGAVHSHMMPVEAPERFKQAIDRAFVDVFGLFGDAELLRDLFIRQLPARPAMPTAQAALFAVRALDPGLGDAILERAAAHYRGA